MFEKVNPSHPDKIADRIAGAMVDYAYTQEENPRVAVEVLLGHGKCYITGETSVEIPLDVIYDIVKRISRDEFIDVEIRIVEQDFKLGLNQSKGLRCGDNGIFKGVPITLEQLDLTELAKRIYADHPFDGKYLMDGDKVVICQSCTDSRELEQYWSTAIVNPLGDWNGGLDVDSGATNRKLGSDMGDSITGGGLHGKDLSKADVSVNIYAWLKAQVTGRPIELSCAIGDDTVDDRPYAEIVDIARQYIKTVGGFEKFAEWGLIRLIR
nr:MAG TPA: S adenosylmethionine synthase [Caudoviricetes sp.]